MKAAITYPGENGGNKTKIVYNLRRRSIVALVRKVNQMEDNLIKVLRLRPKSSFGETIIKYIDVNDFTENFGF